MSDNNQKDPWSGRNQQTPPDLLELISKLFKKQKQTPNSAGSSAPPSDAKTLSMVLILAAIIIAVVWFVSGFFIVAPTDSAPILRFGRYTQTVGPGLHWIPRLADAAFPVNTSTIDTVHVSSDMLTQDENIVSVELAVQFKVDDAKAFLFNVVDPVGSLKQVAFSAMRQTIGENSLDDILTTGRQKIQENIKDIINTTLAPYGTGIEVTDVNLQPAKPPTAVTAAFDDAINAREDKQKYINKAMAYQNQVISMVQGQQSRITQDAEAYKTKTIEEAKGDTARYLALLKPYEQQPTVMGDKLYFDTLTNIFQHTTNIINNTNGHSMVYISSDVFKKKTKADDADVLANDSDSKSIAVSGLLSNNVHNDISQQSLSQNNLALNNPYDNNVRPSYSSEGGQS